MSQAVVTRFAPSPTGFLHIGGARTALFNWLFARHHGGTFLLRIEDTDKKRSTPEATAAIHDGLAWLGLEGDQPAVSQAAQAERHAEVAHEMLTRGAAYKCFSTKEEIDAFREKAAAEKRDTVFRSPWRDADPSTYPDAPYVIRLKAPREGETVIDDQVQGKVTFKNKTFDDLILLRSDGTPTYMLAVVVDDHDMGVTHVIRGDDHLTNAGRQAQIYHAMDWDLPVFAHIPLIHGPDGAKLSKRHGALGVEAYREMGYPAEAIRNYLARLGWSHGDDEVFTTAQAVEWFDLDGVGKAPARFDFKKLTHLSGQHIKMMDTPELMAALDQWCAATDTAMDAEKRNKIETALPLIKERAKILPDLIEMSAFYTEERPFTPDEKAAKQLDETARDRLARLTEQLQHASWSREELEAAVAEFAEDEGAKLGQIAGPLRAALTGCSVSPSVFDIMVLIGQAESLARLSDAARQG
ncbi:glutamate--tRNA ligase [Paracoccaceae bacterium GXU_MW_L88]